MPVLPHQNPVEPDTPEQWEPIHHPQKQDHPAPDHQDDELPESDDEEEDTAADPWWM